MQQPWLEISLVLICLYQIVYSQTRYALSWVAVDTQIYAEVMCETDSKCHYVPLTSKAAVLTASRFSFQHRITVTEEKEIQMFSYLIDSELGLEFRVQQPVQITPGVLVEIDKQRCSTDNVSAERHGVNSQVSCSDSDRDQISVSLRRTQSEPILSRVDIEHIYGDPVSHTIIPTPPPLDNVHYCFQAPSEHSHPIDTYIGVSIDNTPETAITVKEMSAFTYDDEADRGPEPPPIYQNSFVTPKGQAITSDEDLDLHSVPNDLLRDSLDETQGLTAAITDLGLTSYDNTDCESSNSDAVIDIDEVGDLNPMAIISSDSCLDHPLPIISPSVAISTSILDADAIVNDAFCKIIEHDTGTASDGPVVMDADITTLSNGLRDVAVPVIISSEGMSASIALANHTPEYCMASQETETESGVAQIADHEESQSISLPIGSAEQLQNLIDTLHCFSRQQLPSQCCTEFSSIASSLSKVHSSRNRDFQARIRAKSAIKAPIYDLLRLGLPPSLSSAFDLSAPMDRESCSIQRTQIDELQSALLAALKDRCSRLRSMASSKSKTGAILIKCLNESESQIRAEFLKDLDEIRAHYSDPVVVTLSNGDHTDIVTAPHAVISEKIPISSLTIEDVSSATMGEVQTESNPRTEQDSAVPRGSTSNKSRKRRERKSQSDTRVSVEAAPLLFDTSQAPDQNSSEILALQLCQLTFQSVPNLDVISCSIVSHPVQIQQDGLTGEGLIDHHLQDNISKAMRFWKLQLGLLDAVLTLKRPRATYERNPKPYLIIESLVQAIAKIRVGFVQYIVIGTLRGFVSSGGLCPGHRSENEKCRDLLPEDLGPNLKVILEKAQPSLLQTFESMFSQLSDDHCADWIDDLVDACNKEVFSADHQRLYELHQGHVERDFWIMQKLEANPIGSDAEVKDIVATIQRLQETVDEEIVESLDSTTDMFDHIISQVSLLDESNLPLQQVMKEMTPSSTSGVIDLYIQGTLIVILNYIQLQGELVQPKYMYLLQRSKNRVYRHLSEYHGEAFGVQALLQSCLRTLGGDIDQKVKVAMQVLQSNRLRDLIVNRIAQHLPSCSKRDLEKMITKRIKSSRVTDQVMACCSPSLPYLDMLASLPNGLSNALLLCVSRIWKRAFSVKND